MGGGGKINVYVQLQEIQATNDKTVIIRCVIKSDEKNAYDQPFPSFVDHARKPFYPRC